MLDLHQTSNATKGSLISLLMKGVCHRHKGVVKTYDINLIDSYSLRTNTNKRPLLTLLYQMLHIDTLTIL